MVIGRCSIANNSLAPLIEYVAPHVVLARQSKLPNLQRARIHHISTTRASRAMRPPWSLERGAGGDAFKGMKQTSVVPFKRATGVVGIVCGPTIEKVNHEIRLIVSVGILEEQHAWLVHHQNAAVEKFKTRRAVQFVVKNSALVSLTITVGVFQNDELVARARVAWLPLRVARHARNPQPAFVVKIDLHRLGNVGEFCFVGKQLDFKTGWNSRILDKLLWGQIAQGFGFGVLLTGITKSGFRNKQIACTRIIRLGRHGFASSNVVAIAIANRGHGANLGVFLRECLRIECATATVDIPTIHHAVVLRMEP